MLYESFCRMKVVDTKLAAGGKPSTWLPPGGLVEHIKENNQQDSTLSAIPEPSTTATEHHEASTRKAPSGKH